MPGDMATEWIKIATKKETKHDQKFQLLKELMDDWRNRIEYKIANIRAAPVQEGTTFYTNFAPNNNASTKRSKCWIHRANGDHPIWRCRIFAAKSVKERIQLAKQNHACFSCLEIGHPTSSCPKQFICSIAGCGQPHNKLLHDEIPPPQQKPPPNLVQQQQTLQQPPGAPQQTPPQQFQNHHQSTNNNHGVQLPSQ